MKLITAPVRKALDSTPLYTNDGLGKDAPVIVKFFGGGRFTYLVTEANKEDNGDYTFFGWMVSPLGPDCDEFGYSTLSELESIRFPFGLGIERDRQVTPGKYTVKELL